MFVCQRDAQAIDFELGYVTHRAVAEPGPLAHPLIEGTQIRLVVRVVQAEHRRQVLDGGEIFRWASSHALCW